LNVYLGLPEANCPELKQYKLIRLAMSLKGFKFPCLTDAGILSSSEFSMQMQTMKTNSNNVHFVTVPMHLFYENKVCKNVKGQFGVTQEKFFK